MKKFLLLTLLLTAPAMSQAETFSRAGISLAIPAGFKGPVSQQQDRASVYGFTKPSAVTGVKTLLQISVFDMGESIPKLSDKEMWAVSDKYLSNFLKGVERRRSSFNKSKIDHISLGGIPASKIYWNGNYNNIQANGMMYCVIVGKNIISLHTQDAGNKVTKNMWLAIKAIESLQKIK